MMKRPFVIGVLALSGLACEQRANGPSATAPATAPAAAQAETFDARETRLVTLKLPGMV